jgi:dynein assembly factor 5
MPVLAARLGTLEIIEPSEELRLNYVTYLSSVVGICAAKMAPYLSDMISILQRTLVDPYPEVKKVTYTDVLTLRIVYVQCI